MIATRPGPQIWNSAWVWTRVKDYTVWNARRQRWLSLPLRSRYNHDLQLWEVCIHGLLLFHDKAESLAIAAADAWIYQSFPNP